MGTQVSYWGRPFDKAIEAQRYYAVIAPQLRPYGYNGPPARLLTAAGRWPDRGGARSGPGLPPI
jgi:hypothetical protein